MANFFKVGNHIFNLDRIEDVIVFDENLVRVFTSTETNLHGEDAKVFLAKMEEEISGVLCWQCHERKPVDGGLCRRCFDQAEREYQREQHR